MDKSPLSQNENFPFEQTDNSNSMTSTGKRSNAAIKDPTTAKQPACPKKAEHAARGRLIKRVTGAEMARVLEVWDFDKAPQEQDPRTLDLAHELLLMPKHIPNGGFANEANRASTINCVLLKHLRTSLTRLGCVRVGFCFRNGKHVIVGIASPIPQLPTGLQIPYIVLEEEDPFGVITKEQMQRFPRRYPRH